MSFAQSQESMPFQQRQSLDMPALSEKQEELNQSQVSTNPDVQSIRDRLSKAKATLARIREKQY